MAYLMSKLKVLIVGLLFAVVGCAADGMRESASIVKPGATAAAEMLGPYLGRWRPTSFAEEMNVVSLTISATGLSVETGGAMTFTAVRQEARGVVLQITGREPPTSFAAYEAIGMTIEQRTYEGPTHGEQRTQEFLWIYWCDRSDELSGSVEAWQCSHNRYRRWPEG